MQHEIRKYPVNHPLLKNYIKFFWEIRAEYMQLYHKLVPQRNINLRFNLSETLHFIETNGLMHQLEPIFFSGLQNRFINARIKLSGRVHLMGVCFLPDGFYPFVKVPVSEFKNRLLGANEVGIRQANRIIERLKTASNITSRLTVLENELLLMLVENEPKEDRFSQIFNTLKDRDNGLHITIFCQQNNISPRQLERMYNKFIGVSANTYNILNRFHCSVNQIIYNDYSKLSDIAYENGYFDQVHFIKDFKRFAGSTPTSFIRENNTMLNIGKLS